MTMIDLLIKYYPNLTSVQKEQFVALKPLYEQWNSKINVISRKDIDNFYLHHVLHSLSLSNINMIVPGECVLDVGCGGGLPTIPLAILMPDVNFVGIDSIGKKIKVLDDVIESLNLRNVTTINDRVENLDQTFDWVISRAVTDMKTFVAWTWSKTIRGILCLKGGDLLEEIRQTNRKTLIYNISDMYEEDFFETKKIVYLPK